MGVDGRRRGIEEDGMWSRLETGHQSGGYGISCLGERREGGTICRGTGLGLSALE